MWGATNSKRELAFHQTDEFTGFCCKNCGWTTPLTRYWAKGYEPPQEIKVEFDDHICEEWPKLSGLGQYGA